METFMQLSALLLVSMLSVCSSSPLPACSTCQLPSKTKPYNPKVVPPVITPPITVPPIVGTPLLPTHPLVGGWVRPTKPGHPFPPVSSENCPARAIKLGLCVDLLGGLVNVKAGDPVVNQCCPVLKGLVELEAAVCLCLTIKIKLLSLNIFVPLSLQLLAICGLTPPPGYKCA